MSNGDMLPLFQIDGEKDERFEGVFLLGGNVKSKKTAENCGLYWFIRDWAVDDFDGEDHWHSHSSFVIQKEHIKTLARLG